MRRLPASLTALVAACALGASGLAAAAAPTAEPTRQVHGDWEVVCAAQEGGQHCALVQQQTADQGRQRVLAVELAPRGAGLEGTVLLPFGLDLAAGLRLQVDEGAKGAPMAFRTCIPSGCIVPLNVDASLDRQLRSAGLLKLHAVTADGARAVEFRVSLRGYREAREAL